MSTIDEIDRVARRRLALWRAAKDTSDVPLLAWQLDHLYSRKRFERTLAPVTFSDERFLEIVRGLQKDDLEPAGRQTAFTSRG